MNISKTTINFAKRRNVELWEDEGVLYFTVDAENNECCAIEYTVTDEGLFLLRQHDNILEDMPNWVENETKLRELIAYIAEAVC